MMSQQSGDSFAALIRVNTVVQAVVGNMDIRGETRAEFQGRQEADINPKREKQSRVPVPKNSKPSSLNDYRPVALTSTVMKVFERLLKKHICSSIPATLDPLQFAYRPNRSTDDAISQVLHSSLTHIDSKNGNYVRLLFIDYSSAFNTIVPTKLAVKLSDLGLNTSLCDWI